MTSRSSCCLAAILICLEVLVVSCSSSASREPTATPKSTPSSTPWPLLLGMSQTMTANSTYLEDCRAIYAVGGMHQLAYRGILPGTTNSDELTRLTGVPMEVRGHQQVERIFEDFTVTLEADVVESILVEPAVAVYGSLRETLVALGCPDLVLATSTVEDAYPGAYDGTQFIYLRLGVVFTFDHHPVEIDSLPIYTQYFIPTSLRGYLEWAHLDRDFAIRQRPVDWEAAVR